MCSISKNEQQYIKYLIAYSAYLAINYYVNLSFDNPLIYSDESYGFDDSLPYECYIWILTKFITKS